ncbi:MAG TPA: phosphoribosyltransferase [Jatrophihabitans sp.]|nr:phosphoribosyltransferase [Jatrophihabitans sp.]
MSTSWVADRLGLVLQDEPGGLVPVRELVGLAVRVNPKRAHLLVSTVLGKHIPVDPRVCYAAGRLLGAIVAGRQPPVELSRAALTGDGPAAAQLVRLLNPMVTGRPDTAVLGYAETATGLGHAVADSLGARYLHSTRREVAGVASLAGFEEEHSHATGHLLLPEDGDFLSRADEIVLVDDELSTGRTALNTIRALLGAGTACRQFVVAALIDVRDDPAAFDAEAAALGVAVRVAALARGRVHAPADVLARGQALVAAQRAPGSSDSHWHDPIELAPWRACVREGGRHGFAPVDRVALERQAALTAAAIRPTLHGDRVLVLGCEELMYAPLRIAEALAGFAGLTVRFLSTTRSPVLPVADPGYAIRSRLSFPAHDASGDRFAYNLDDRDFTDIVWVIDDAGRPVAGPPATHLVTIPAYRPPAGQPLHGPLFGSYRAEEVGWLLTDLSGVELEAPTEEREEAIQQGGAHYAESLPVEFRPNAQYQRVYADALANSALEVARAVATVTELVLAERGRSVVLASLARAGTPIGILMRRWAERRHGLQLPHYAVSIVRGRGIDRAALRYLAGRYDPAQVVFVDGWTGKGAIARELAEAVRAARDIGPFSADLAVLADTGHCVRTFGTRADFLIPSACLNSTVSGLVSRTVLNDQLIAPGQFHGAKFYAELAGEDRSAEFIDTITARFEEVEPVLPSDREPTWAGWRTVEHLAERYGIGNVNLVKPGVGETTRVLLRRVPWRVLIDPDRQHAVHHVTLLAEQRGVPVEQVAGLGYSCVGLIHPGFSRQPTEASDRNRVVAR